MRCALLLLAALMPLAVWPAQWELVQETVPFSTRTSVPVALVVSDDGNSLRVYIDDAGNVRGMLSLRNGFDAFSNRMCPTYQVDDRQPRVVELAGELCEIDGKRAYFSFGKQEGTRIVSTQLHRLMNGNAVVFRYQLESVGYRQASFSLTRSKYAVESAVGNGVRIDKE